MNISSRINARPAQVIGNIDGWMYCSTREEKISTLLDKIVKVVQSKPQFYTDKTKIIVKQLSEVCNKINSTSWQSDPQATEANLNSLKTERNALILQLKNEYLKWYEEKIKTTNLPDKLSRYYFDLTNIKNILEKF